MALPVCWLAPVPPGWSRADAVDDVVCPCDADLELSDPALEGGAGEGLILVEGVFDPSECVESAFEP